MNFTRGPRTRVGDRFYLTSDNLHFRESTDHTFSLGPHIPVLRLS